MEQRKLNPFVNPLTDEGYVGFCQKKWQPLMESSWSDSKKRTMALLFENQARSSETQLKKLNEDSTTTADLASYVKYLFPTVRRVWPTLIANDIVSVQPMSAPIGGVSYFKAMFNTNKGSISTGTEMITNTNFSRWYSSDYVDGEVLSANNTAVSFIPIMKHGATGMLSTYYFTVTYTKTGVVKTAIDDGIDSLYVGAVKVGTIDYVVGTINITDTPDVSTPITCYYKYNMELNSKIPEVSLQIQLDEIRAGSRKLKTIWSSEAAEDVKALYGLDAEGELVSMVASEIALEVDREIIMDIEGAVDSIATLHWDMDVSPGISEVAHFRSILTQLSNLSNTIHKRSFRSPGNWIVCSPDVSAIFDQFATHGDYRPILAGADKGTREPVMPPQNAGVYYAGTLQSKWAVYVDPFFPKNELIMGLKGQTFMDAGYVYAPYIPLQLTPTFLDPADFSMRKGLRTRYAKKLIRSEFYAKLLVDHMP